MVYREQIYFSIYQIDLVDAIYGGFFHHFRDDGSIYDRQTRHLVSSTRFIFNYCEAARYFDNAQYVSLKVKDALVDRIRKKTGNRPDVDKVNPRYTLFLYIFEDKVSIYLNSSGNSLSKRGYREKIHKASLNEALAAGIILLSGWKPNQIFYDPMCGSGTFSIEAAMIGRNIPAGYYRKGYAFQKWDHFDNRLWNTIVTEAREKILHKRLKIFAYDNIAANIDLSKQNSRRILIHNYIRFKKAEICVIGFTKKVLFVRFK